MFQSSDTFEYQQLLRVIRHVRNRWRLRKLLHGLIPVILFGLLTLGIATFAMDFFRYSSWAINAFRILTYVALAGLAFRFLIRPLVRRVSDEQVALYIEEHVPELKQGLSSAVEIGSDERSPDAPPLSTALVEKLVSQMVDQCETIDYGEAVERDALKSTSWYLVAGAAAGMVAVLLSPGFVRYGASLIFNPFRSAQAASPYSIDVHPGNLSVAKGADQEIRAMLSGFDSDEVQLSMKREDEERWERAPMIVDGETGEFGFMMFNLGSRTDYFVEANGVRSNEFRLDVTDLPYVKQIDLEYLFPAYTGLSPRAEEDGGDIAALRGTEVKLLVFPTVSVRGGQLDVDGQEPVPLELSEPEGHLTGSLVVRKGGFYRIQLQAFDGTYKVASPDFVIEVLNDQPPSIHFSKPGRDSKVTPIEEVFTEVKSEDDYGVARLELVYSVNGSSEKKIALYRGKGKSDLSAGHTFFLEDFELQPGDIISYYATAYDGASVTGPQKATTDIYFIEARPFDQTYRQADAGGMQGGGGGGMDGNLSVRQREIVAATFKVVRDREKLTKKDVGENLTTIGLMQGRLREQVETLIRRMGNRGIAQQQNEFGQIAEHLNKAIEVMGPAEEKLVAGDPESALPLEQQALQHLQRADAVFREVQVSFQQGGGGGGGQQTSAEDLADLFELEMDKLRNQYETVQRGERQSVDNEVDEALQRLQELARRQQQENERMKRQASRLQSQGGGGGQAAQRELAEEAEELARQLEKLSREQSLPDLDSTARRLQDAANAMRRASTRREQSAIAEGLRALDELKDARRLLDKNRDARLDRDVNDAMEQAERVRAMQERVASDVREMGLNGQDAEKMQRVFERKDEMAEELQSLESQMDSMSRDVRKENRAASDKLQEAADHIRDSKLKEKVRYSKGVVEGRIGEFAENFEQGIGEDISELQRRLGEVKGAIGQSEQGQVAEAVDKTRELVQNLESLGDRIRERQEQAQQDQESQRAQQAQQERRLGDRQGPQGEESPEGDRNGNEQGEEPSSQANEDGQSDSSQPQNGQAGQQGQQNQQGEQGQQGQGQQQGQQGQQGGGGSSGPTSVGSGDASSFQPGTFSSEEIRQLGREFRERVADAEQLRRELRQQNLDVPDLNEIIKRMKEFEEKDIFLNPLGVDELEQAVVEDLKQFEFWLRRQLQGLEEGDLLVSGSHQVPDEYKTLVEEYFRSLSRSR